MIKTGYKIVRNPSNYNNMIFLPGFYYIRNLFYKLHKRTYHKLGDGSLAVFDTFENAIKFLAASHTKLDSYHNLFECNYKPENTPKQRKLFHVYWIKNKNSEMIPITEDYKDDYISYPKGTEFARWVQLTKEVVLDE